jgi:hypothetical protein
MSSDRAESSLPAQCKSKIIICLERFWAVHVTTLCQRWRRPFGFVDSVCEYFLSTFWCNMPSCAVLGCSSEHSGTPTRLHKFPVHDAERLRLWIAFTKRPNYSPHHASRICGGHFSLQCYDARGMLCSTAVPTLEPADTTNPANTYGDLGR